MMFLDNDELDLRYFNWLANKIRGDNIDIEEFSEALFVLYTKQFDYIIPDDENRLVDGINLFHEFLDENDIKVRPDHKYFYQASVLSVMVALSIHIEDILTDMNHENQNRWFFEMLNNIYPLECLKNSAFSIYYRSEFSNAIDRFINRNYESDGRGGLFIISPIVYDLRTIPIWTQMMWYCSQNVTNN